MSCEHVAEQTDGKRDEAQEGREKLDDPHKHVHREAHALRGEALDVADHAVSLASVVDEVHEGEDGERGGGADCAGAGLHSRNQANHVIDQDEQEKRAQEREVLLPVLTHDTLADIVLDVLDDVLETVDEEALGNQGLLLLEHGQDDQEHDRGDDQPKRVLRDAAAQIAHDRGGAELADQMINLIRQLFKNFHDLPFDLMRISQHLGDANRAGGHKGHEADRLAQEEHAKCLSEQHKHNQGKDEQGDCRDRQAHHTLEHVRILFIVKNRLERKNKGKKGDRARDGACNDSEQIGYLKHWRPHFLFLTLPRTVPAKHW